ncbi:MAG TPA: PVC-type heme-binding CxxCH protein [Pirellulaceae bacterium]|jgi:quinoprotein glucose dehydrogenase|nr:PVC-type heme-binding CxxCH protein [Pirellulaceae bacterium]
MLVRFASKSLLAAASLIVAVLTFAQETPPPLPPQIAAASAEGEQAIPSFKVPAGLKTELVAAEPLVANIVAFDVDAQGRLFVCETFRQKRGVEDNRSHGDWLDDDLAARTVEDRIAYIKKRLGDKAVEYTKHDDRIRLLQDTNRNGKFEASEAQVFAAGFNDLEMGTGAGVLAYDGAVYYTCIPDLFRLVDTDGDGKSDERESLHTGYGVRFAFRGHDMHGLIVGPDRRLYFSIGDRGYNVVSKEGTRFENPESGAVFRCDLDGSNLEVVHTGLRNPQELAFDDYGNLFTGDNNSDSGDKAKWFVIAEGADAGWRMYYQYLSDRGPYNREKLWHPHHEGQAAYILPAIANLSDGPSGLASYPGVGLPEFFDGRFLLCDFRGQSGNSGIRTFRCVPKGAFFEVVDEDQTFWNILATDVCFGPGGAIYVSDWVNGWEGEGKGRIYRFFDPTLAKSELVQETKRLLASDLRSLKPDQLIELLSHADRRVRYEAQFALAHLAETRRFMEVAADDQRPLLARLHATWGLGQLGRASEPARELSRGALVVLLDAQDEEVRGQAAKLCGDLDIEAAAPRLRQMLSEGAPRPAYFAAIALGRLQDAEAVEPLIKLLETNADADPMLRHAAIMGLVGSATAEDLTGRAAHMQPAARLAAVVALRKRQAPEAAFFLQDADRRIVLEAARAIHDAPIPEAFAALATLPIAAEDERALVERVLNANYRLGGTENADRVAAVAASNGYSDEMRMEALRMLASWAEPSPKDRVLNRWDPLPTRDAKSAEAAFRGQLAGIFDAPSAVQSEAVKTAAILGIQEVLPALERFLTDADVPAEQRGASLAALEKLHAPNLEELVAKSLGDSAPEIRAAARDVLSRTSPDKATKELAKALDSESVYEVQAAYATLAKLPAELSAPVLRERTEQLLAGEIAAAVRLDLLTAAEAVDDRALKAALAEYEKTRKVDDSIAAYREALEGGDARRGAELFYGRASLSCVRCHKALGTGGEVGPDLTELGKKKDREYLLAAITVPNRDIAENFETLMVITDDGRIHSGILREETDEEIVLMTPEGTLDRIDASTVEGRRKGKSSMPEDLMKNLTKSELRDLVEFLVHPVPPAGAPAAEGHRE